MVQLCTLFFLQTEHESENRVDCIRKGIERNMYNARQAKRDSLSGQRRKKRLIKKTEEDRLERLREAKQFAKDNLDFTLKDVHKSIQKATKEGKHQTTYNLGANFDNEYNTTYTANLTRLIVKKLVNQGFKAAYKHKVEYGVKHYDEARPECWIYYTISIDWK